LKVSQADYDAYKNLVSQTYATTVWTSGQISNYVLKADYDGATVASLINQTPDSVKIFANKIDIRAGEYNSVRDSEFLITTNLGVGTGVSVLSPSNMANPFGVQKSIRTYTIGAGSSIPHFRFYNIIAKNGTYTFSAYIRVGKACRVVMGIADNAGSAIDLQANVWKRCYVTVTVNNFSSATYHFADLLFQETTGASMANATVYLTMVKVEEGNFLTNWTLHPDEVAAGIKSAITQALTGFESELGKMAWQDTVEAAMKAETLIVGGYLRTTLIDVIGLQAEIVKANYIEGLKVNFKQGTIGGFDIYIDRLESLKEDSTFSLIPGKYVAFINDKANIWAGIGQYIVPNTNSIAVARFENNYVSGAINIDNYALYVSAKGAFNKENHAIAIAAGYISGLSVKPKIISTGTTGYTITQADVFLTCYNQTTLSLYLPANPQPGKILFIRRMNSSAINVYGNGKMINNYATDTRSSIDVGGGAGDVAMFFYDGDLWTYNYLVRKA